MPLDYDSVKKMYDTLYGAGVTRKSLPDWATEEKAASGSDLYDTAINAGPWTRTSHWLDTNVFHPAAAVTTEPLGQGIGAFFGNEAAGARVGRDLPRSLLETAPLYLAGPETGIPATVAALTGTGGLMAAHTYADTGSGKAAAISGVTGAALPLIGKFGGNLAARALGLGEYVAPTLTETAGQQGLFSGGILAKSEDVATAFKATHFAGSQAAQILANQVSMAATDKVLNQPYDPLSPDFWLQQIPFTVYDGYHGIRAKATTAEGVRAIAPQAKLEPKVEHVPISNPEAEEKLASTFDKLQQVLADPSVPQSDREAALSAAFATAGDPKSVIKAQRETQAPKLDEVLKAQQENPELPKQDVPSEDPFKDTLAPHEEKVLEDSGVAVPKVDPMLDPEQNPQGTMAAIEEIKRRNASLKPFAQQMVEADTQIESAKKAVEVVPKSPEEIGHLLSRNEVPAIRLPDGTVYSDPRGHPFAYDHAVEEGKAVEAQQLPGGGTDDRVQPTKIVKGAIINGKFIENPKLELKQKIESTMAEGVSTTSAVEVARLQQHTPIIDAALETKNVAKTQAEKVISTWQGKPQAIYGDAVRDTNGENFKTKELADAFKESDPDLAEHVVRNAGKDKGFYLAPVVNKEVSLEGTQLEKVLQNNPIEPKIDSRPDVSIQDVTDTLTRAGKEPAVMDELLGNNDLAQTLKELKLTREFFQNKLAGKDVTVGPEMRKVIQKVTRTTGEWNRRFRSFTMDSIVPPDESLVAKMGIREGGVKAWTNWFTQHPQSGPMGTLLSDMLKAKPDLTNIDLGYDALRGPEYQAATGGESAKIWLTHEPSNENDAFRLSLNLAHELAHHAGRELMKPDVVQSPGGAALLSTLKQIRNHLGEAKNIPLEVRNTIKTALKEGWYDDYAHRRISTDELYQKFLDSAGEKNAKHFDLFYGMQDEHELLAQVFQSHEVVDALSQTKVPKMQETSLGYFSRAWNHLFGGKVGNDNALAEILGKFENYLKPKTYGDNERLPYSGRDYLRDSLISKGVRDSAVTSRIDTVEKIFSNGDLSASMDGFQREAEHGQLPATTEAPEFIPKGSAAAKYGDQVIGPAPTHGHVFEQADAQLGAESKADSTGFLTNKGRYVNDREAAAMKGVDTPALDASQLDQPNKTFFDPNVRETVLSGTPSDVSMAVKDLLMKDVPSHEALWERMQQDVKTAQDLVKNIEAGKVPGTVPEGIPSKLEESMSKLNAFKRALDKQGRDISRFNDLNNFTEDGARRSIIASLLGRKPNLPPDPTGVEPEAMTALGFADESGRTKAARATLEGTNGPGFFSRMFKQMQFLKQMYPEFKNVANHADETQGDMSQRMVELNYARTHPEVDTDSAASKEISKSIMRVNANPRLNGPASDILRYIQQVEQVGGTWKWSDAFIRDKLRGSQDIKNAIVAEQSRYAHHIDQMSLHLSKYNQYSTAKIIATLERGMMPQDATDVAQGMYQALGLLKAPETSTLGMEQLRMLSSKMQPDTYMKALAFSQGLIQDAEKTLTVMKAHPTYVSEVRYDKNHLIMTGPNGEPYRGGFDKVSDAQAEMQKREQQGWKLVDFVKRQDSNAPNTGVSNEMMNTLQELDLQHENRMKTAFKDLDPQVLAALLPTTQRAAEYRLTLMGSTPLPGSVGARTRQFVAGRENINMLKNADTYYHTTNNWMRNRELRAQTDLDLLHPELQDNRTLSTLAQKYIEEQLTPDNSFIRKVNEATYNWRLAWNFGVNFLHGIQSLTTGMSAAISETGSVGDAFALTGKAMQAIIHRGVKGSWENPGHEFLNNRLSATGSKGIATYDTFIDQDRAAVYDSNNILGKSAGAINTVKYAARSWTNMFATFNDTIGAIVGWDLAKSRGMSDEDSYRFAKDMKDRGYFSPGKVGRSIGLWDTNNKAVPQLMSSLNTYTLSWFSMLSNNWSRGFGTAPKDMTPLERQGAKKAFLYQLGAQAVLAGAIGLPGVGQGMALLKQTTGIDSKSWLREHLADFFDEDQENGGILTSMALHGGVAAFSPLDVSGRHIPNFPFLGISPSTGFDAKNLLPAPIATASDFVQGLIAAAKGDAEGIQKAIPHVLQGPIQLMQQGGDVRDKQDSLLYQMSPADRFVTALGMTPSAVQTHRDVATAVKEANDVVTQEKSALVNKVAETYRTKGADEGKKALVDYLSQHPEEDGKALVTAVTQRAEAQTFPVDPMRNVKASADLTGLSRVVPSNEVERLNYRSKVMGDFGIGSVPSYLEQRKAQTVDDIINSDPYGLARTQAIQRARQSGQLKSPALSRSTPDYLMPSRATGY